MNTDNGTTDTHPAVASAGQEHRAPLLGTVLTLPGAVTAELAAEPFDFVWIDLEHGALSRSDAQDLLIGAQSTGAWAFVRIGNRDIDSLAGPMLDAGADGIVAADIRDAAQAQRAARTVRYPPAGVRGYGPRRAALRGRIRTRAPSRHPELWLQIESRRGVAAASEISQTDGVDAIVVGIADLCSDLGIPITLEQPVLHEALATVRDAAAAAEVPFGLAGPLHTPEELAYLFADARMLIHSTEARMFAAALDTAVERLRDAYRHVSAASSCRASGHLHG